MKAKQIKKGSDEAQFFNEYLVFRQKYYECENQDDFEILVAQADELTKKYENCDFGKYARQIVLAHLEDVEVRWMNDKS